MTDDATFWIYLCADASANGGKDWLHGLLIVLSPTGNTTHKYNRQTSEHINTHIWAYETHMQTYMKQSLHDPSHGWKARGVMGGGR